MSTSALAASLTLPCGATRAVTAAISGEGVIEVHGKPPSVTQAIDGKGELRVL
ncbi:MAG TPA: hypothetical protein PKU97_18345 [Kofleriaceae bacterium]|nr:hypothetical protein [Kofleriaceae bacterium]